MATIAQIADELSSSPAATTKAPAAELALQVSERERRLSALTAARDLAATDLGLIEQPATRLAAADMRLTAGAELALKPGAELLLHSPAASVVLEAGAALVLEKGSILTVGEPTVRAREVVLAANQAAASRLAGVSDFLEPRAALASIVAEQYERPLREVAFAFDGITRPAEVARQIFEGAHLYVTETTKQFVDSLGLLQQQQQQVFAGMADNLSRLAGLSDTLLSPAELAAIADIGQPSRLAKQALEQFYADERRLEREQQALTRFLEGEQRAASRGERALLAELPDVDQMIDALWARRAPAAHVTQVGALVEIEPVAWPPPQNGNFGIPPAQPGQPGGELLAIAYDILSGRVSSKEQVVKRLLMIERGSQQPPQWESIELIALDYERNGHRYQNMTAFAAKHRLSRDTLNEYLKTYEAATGKQVRPGPVSYTHLTLPTNREV